MTCHSASNRDPARYRRKSLNEHGYCAHGWGPDWTPIQSPKNHRVPLAEIAYTDAGGAPVLFCVFADDKPDAPPRTVAREGVSYVTWSREGKSYMFVAHMFEQQVADLAQTLSARF